MHQIAKFYRDSCRDLSAVILEEDHDEKEGLLGVVFQNEDPDVLDEKGNPEEWVTFFADQSQRADMVKWFRSIADKIESLGIDTPGIRDPKAPCENFNIEVDMHLDCPGDGHYLCPECCHCSIPK